MTLEEKKQIYLNKFPAIIGKRMADQLEIRKSMEWNSKFYLSDLVVYFNYWSQTNEKYGFWEDIHFLYCGGNEIYHQQILDIFHKHNIKP